MRPDVDAATARAAAVRARLARTSEPELLADDVADALCEGYAQALAGDAWLTASDLRLHEMIDDTTRDRRGRELRVLARETGQFQRHVIALRAELESLRRDYDRLRARSHARTA